VGGGEFAPGVPVRDRRRSYPRLMRSLLTTAAVIVTVTIALSSTASAAPPWTAASTLGTTGREAVAPEIAAVPDGETAPTRLFGAPALGAEGPMSPPQTRITFGPEGLTNLRRPVYAYESDDPEARFECRLDAAPFAPCNLVETEVPEEPPDAKLSTGPHTFEVSAVNLAGVADPTPARAHIVVDFTGPTVRILKGPLGLTHTRRPTFRFRVRGASAVRCSLVIAGRYPRLHRCTGRNRFRPRRRLRPAEYLFTVRAFDRAENTGEAVRYFDLPVRQP
jgi:hypothetical protein